MPTMTLTWVVSPEHHHCPYCAALYGRTWIWVSGMPFPDVLCEGLEAVWDTVASSLKQLRKMLYDTPLLRREQTRWPII